MVDGPTSPLSDVVRSIRRRASQQSTQHAWMSDRYSLHHSAITTVSLVTGATLLAIIMAPSMLVQSTLGVSPGAWTWITALAAALSYSVIVLQLAWKYDVKADRHTQAVRHYARISAKAAVLLASDQPLDQRSVETLQRDYLDDQELPRIPERYFLITKKWHLDKVAASRSLDTEHDVSLPRSP